MTPISAARFSITVDGYEIASFSELQGITTEIETVEYARLGLDRLAVQSSTRDRRGRMLSFVQPRSTNQKLLAWHRAAIGRSPGALKKAVLVLFDAAGDPSKPAARYQLTAAWPSAIEPQAPKQGNAVALEKVTIAYEGFERA
jgi:phage tail-like protein